MSDPVIPKLIIVDCPHCGEPNTFMYRHHVTPFGEAHCQHCKQLFWSARMLQLSKSGTEIVKGEANA